MFIRSKHSGNIILNSCLIDWPVKVNCNPSFAIAFGPHTTYIWEYDTKEQRDSEYEWILSKLDCFVNEENVTGPVIKRISPDICKCGGHAYLTTHSGFNICCDECSAHAYSKLSVEHTWQLWDSVQLKMEISDKIIVHDTTASISYVKGDEFTDGSKRKNRHAGSTLYHNEERINGVWKIA